MRMCCLFQPYFKLSKKRKRSTSSQRVTMQHGLSLWVACFCYFFCFWNIKRKCQIIIRSQNDITTMSILRYLVKDIVIFFSVEVGSMAKIFYDGNVILYHGSGLYHNTVTLLYIQLRNGLKVHYFTFYSN